MSKNKALSVLRKAFSIKLKRAEGLSLGLKLKLLVELTTPASFSNKSPTKHGSNSNPAKILQNFFGN